MHKQHLIRTIILDILFLLVLPWYIKTCCPLPQNFAEVISQTLSLRLFSAIHDIQDFLFICALKLSSVDSYLSRFSGHIDLNLVCSDLGIPAFL